MKACKSCQLNLNESVFRKKLDKRDGKYYLSSNCIKCESELARIYHNKRKDDPIFKEKNRQRTKNWSIENYEYIQEYNKYRRSIPENKERRKEYNEANRDIIRLHSNKCNDKYIKKQRNSITDQYAIIQICHPRNGITRDMVTKEMIELKKIDIVIDRIKKQINKINNGQKN